MKKSMKWLTLGVLLVSLLVWGMPAAAAPAIKLATPNQMGVAMGQLYYTVRDVQANQKFWVAMGAAPVRMNEKQAVLKLPDLLISLNKGEPSANSAGAVLVHVSFQVPNVQQTLANMRAAGYKTLGAPSGSKLVGYAFTPEGEQIEFLEDRSENVQITFDDGKVVNGRAGGPKMAAPIILHHIHFNVPDSAVPQIKAWYIKNFGAVSCKRWHYEAADLPGMNINISGDPKKLAPTKGRMLDHIGFEVKDLKAFCKKLQANGVKLDQPYTKQPSGLATASLTDPWGTSIVLTEGLSSHSY